jgi:predicted ester cyclase
LDKAFYYFDMHSDHGREETNKAIVLEVLDRIFTHSDPTVLEEHPGLTETVKQISRRSAAFPDLTFRVEAVIAEGDTVAYLARFKGTHLGVFAGVPATGRAIEYKAVGLDRLEGGRIVEHHATADYLGVLDQLGVLPLKT